MGAYILGVVLFAVGIAATIALHEAGHLTVAKLCGMRVRRYFIGFGPKLWSFRRGHTEYGVAAVPLGGFCDIAGMTNQDDVTPEEAPHAMRFKPWWQRIAVLLGGIAVNLLLGFLILYLMAVTSGIPNTHADRTAVVGEFSCVSDQLPDGTLEECTGSSPAREAGLEEGDRVLSVNGEAVSTFLELRDAIAAVPGQTVVLGVERGNEDLEISIEVPEVIRYSSDGEATTAGAIGVVSAPIQDAVRSYGPVSALGATASYSGELLKATVEGIAQLPSRVPSVVASIFGAERSQDSPMSVVGASRVGGELVENSLWSMFWMMLASLNYFLALFNLIPLPPFDGGHVAVVFWEKIRDAFRRLRGLPPGGPADYTRLLPLTYAMAAVLMALGVVFIVADVVNPVRLF